MVVVYKNPSDHPGKYVARLWSIEKWALPIPAKTVIVKDSIEEIRKEIPQRFMRFLPDVYDDPVIAEIWI